MERKRRDVVRSRDDDVDVGEPLVHRGQRQVGGELVGSQLLDRGRMNAFPLEAGDRLDRRVVDRAVHRCRPSVDVVGDPAPEVRIPRPHDVGDVDRGCDGDDLVAGVVENVAELHQTGFDPGAQRGGTTWVPTYNLASEFYSPVIYDRPDLFFKRSQS